MKIIFWAEAGSKRSGLGKNDIAEELPGGICPGVPVPRGMKGDEIYRMENDSSYRFTHMSNRCEFYGINHANCIRGTPHITGTTLSV